MWAKSKKMLKLVMNKGATQSSLLRERSCALKITFFTWGMVDIITHYFRSIFKLKRIHKYVYKHTFFMTAQENDGGT